MIGTGWVMTIIIGAIAGFIAERGLKFATGMGRNNIPGLGGAMVGN